jgi:tetratricopeptide (TPR) repeat protein
MPLRVRAQALVQKITGSKHSTWAAAAVIGLLAVGTGYLLGKTTDGDSSVAAATTPPPIETRVAFAAPPREPAQIADSTDGMAQPGGDLPLTPESGSEVSPEATPGASPSLTSTIPGGDSPSQADERAAEEARKKKKEEDARILAERRKAEKELREEQRRKTEQAQRDREARVKELLQLAKIDISKGRLVSPANENAVDRYRELLTKEPSATDAQEARNGLKRVAEILVQEVDRALANGNMELAGQLLNSLRSVQGDHPDMARLQDRLNDGGGGKALSARDRNNIQRAQQRAENALSRDPQTLGTIKDAVKEYGRIQLISNVAVGMSILRGQIEEAFAAAARYEMSKGNVKAVREIIAIARSRRWLTPDLLQIEKTMDATQSP